MRTTVPDAKQPCSLDLVDRNFHASRPNQLWVVGFTCMSTWQGWLYVANTRDAFDRRIVGWQTSTSMSTDFVLDALEQALHARRPAKGRYHGDKGAQYLSLCHTERLRQAGVAASVGSTDDAFDNASAETINGLYKVELVNRCGPWKSCQPLVLITLISDIAPVEAEAKCFSRRTIERSSAKASTSPNQPRRLPE